MKLPYYIAIVGAVALIAGCGEKEGAVQQPAKGPAVTGSGTNGVVKTTVTPAPPPPVTASKPATSLFPPSGAPAAAAKPASSTPDAKPVVPPAKSATEAKPAPAQTTAKVVMVNKEMKFVVLEFTNSAVPTAGSPLSLYRGKERVASLKATEPMKPPLVTADILDGDARKGDEVR
jgi:hypothetical protein